MTDVFDTIDAEPLDREAERILRLNDRGGYTVPTEGLYPYQWNWDSAFAGLGFAAFDIDRAWTEIETLFSGQWGNGMVPHILFHRVDAGYFPGPDVWGTEDALGRGACKVPSSGISQPPVVASLAWRIYLADPTAGHDRLAALFPKLLAYHRWIMAARAESGAVAITHPWEAGRDNAPDWDEAMAGIDPVGVAPYTRRDTGHVDPRMRPTQADYDRYIWLVQFARERRWGRGRHRRRKPVPRGRSDDEPSPRCAPPATCGCAAELLGAGTDEIDEVGSRGLEDGAAMLWNPETGAYDARNLRTGNFAGSVSKCVLPELVGGAGGPAPAGDAPQGDDGPRANGPAQP